MLLAMAAGPLMAQSAKEVADSLTIIQPEAGAQQLPLPAVPEGVDIRIGGADYEQIVTSDGHIAPVLSPTPVQVFFRVTKDGESADSKDYEYMVMPAVAAAEGVNEKPRVIPALLQWQGGVGHVDVRNFAKGFSILTTDEYAEVAKLLAADLQREVGIPVAVLTEAEAQAPHPPVLVVLGRADAPTAGAEPFPVESLGHEGYLMRTTAGSEPRVLIAASSPVGLYWGTRTLIQELRSHDGRLPAGTAVDYPRYALRGFMFDIARTPFTLGDLRRVVDLMAAFKMNDLHLVMNNNYIFHEHYVDAGRDPFKESYSAFRLESKVKGEDGTPLTAQDLAYSKADFRALIDYARVRGVRIVPEFDTPGHALSFTRVRPDLIYQGPMRGHVKRRCEMLDAASSETLRFVGGVFDEYLLPDAELGRPVFEGCVVHVGSDEFFGAAEDYRRYTDGILRHVLSRGYTPRVWGSLSAKRGSTPVVSEGVQMNLWSTGWMNPAEAVEAGYQVINTNDANLYIVPFANYYRADWNRKGLYNNWKPNRIGGLQLPAGHPQLLGATFAVWNDTTDLLHNGYCLADIWDSISGMVDVLCEKMWGVETPPSSFEQHNALASAVSTPLVGEPRTARFQLTPTELPMQLNVPPSRPEYHLTVELELRERRQGEEQVLLAGPEGELVAVMKDGSVGFRRADSVEFSWGASLPVGKKLTLELVGTPGKTRLFIDGKEVTDITLKSFRNRDEAFQPRTQGVISTFALPLQTIAPSFRGAVYSISLE